MLNVDLDICTVDETLDAVLANLIDGLPISTTVLSNGSPTAWPEVRFSTDDPAALSTLFSRYGDDLSEYVYTS